MRAVMHEQIPGIGNERARNESASRDQIDQREANPYLPKNCEDRVVRIGVMQPMFGWCETMQHKAMNDIFGKGPCNDAAGEKHSVRTHSEPRNGKQDDCEQRRYEYFAEIDDGGPGSIRGAAPSDAPPRSALRRRDTQRSSPGVYRKPNPS